MLAPARASSTAVDFFILSILCWVQPLSRVLTPLISVSRTSAVLDSSTYTTPPDEEIIFLFSSRLPGRNRSRKRPRRRFSPNKKTKMYKQSRTGDARLGVMATAIGSSQSEPREACKLCGQGSGVNGKSWEFSSLYCD